MIQKALAQGLELIEIDPAIPETQTLDLGSLQIVMLVEHLESELDILFDGNDVTRENFASKATLLALLERKVKSTP